MAQNDPNLLRIWHQARIPVVVLGGPVRRLIVRLPYAPANRDWLQDRHRTKPVWLPKQQVWTIPKSWFEDVLRRALLRYGAVYVIQPFRKDEKCAPACWNAVGAHCECSCMGENHGAGEPEGKWHVVSETLAVRVNAKEYSCRLLRPNR
jgi:hypothetical protein